ncbi:hypothetical protein BHE74_00058807 [Ensete ventricosum]|uniref:Uncharacterized protein n=1 Tax=Ensete ventricosum TaxID=4639 RepID=A0A426X6M7_ENSVE|nr:hypothetical protein B296_00056458 [Ensete ventricosum]RWW36191.1 hypothetical protein BHE74_00058807 [Ensete ventricosum]RZS27926.1 hypothetical protein BHM03_00061462 [Ensete ventricosum]
MHLRELSFDFVILSSSSRTHLKILRPRITYVCRNAKARKHFCAKEFDWQLLHRIERTAIHRIGEIDRGLDAKDQKRRHPYGLPVLCQIPVAVRSGDISQDHRVRPGSQVYNSYFFLLVELWRMLTAMARPICTEMRRTPKKALMQARKSNLSTFHSRNAPRTSISPITAAIMIADSITLGV